MNKAVLILMVGVLFAMIGQQTSAVANAAKGKVGKTHRPSSERQLETDVKFGNSVVNGKYQMPDEATARIENDKSLSDLLPVRKNFKDRLQEASVQE